jgi:thymidylate kinase
LFYFLKKILPNFFFSVKRPNLTIILKIDLRFAKKEKKGKKEKREKREKTKDQVLVCLHKREKRPAVCVNET